MRRVLTIAAFALLAGCGGGQPDFDRTIDPSEVEGRWPLKAATVEIDCGNGLDVFLISGGTAYQIRGGERSAEHRLPIEDLRKLRLENPDYQQISPGVLYDMSNVFELALRRCREAGLAKYSEP